MKNGCCALSARGTSLCVGDDRFLQSERLFHGIGKMIPCRFWTSLHTFRGICSSRLEETGKSDERY